MKKLDDLQDHPSLRDGVSLLVRGNESSQGASMNLSHWKKVWRGWTAGVQIPLSVTSRGVLHVKNLLNTFFPSGP